MCIRDSFNGKVPLKVKTIKNVYSNVPGYADRIGAKEPIVCLKDHTYYAWVNSYGAVSAILPTGIKLGLYPSEFEVVEWHA